MLLKKKKETGSVNFTFKFQHKFFSPLEITKQWFKTFLFLRSKSTKSCEVINTQLTDGTTQTRMQTKTYKIVISVSRTITVWTLINTNS